MLSKSKLQHINDHVLKNELKTQLRATNGHHEPQVMKEKENQKYEAKNEKEHIENTCILKNYNMYSTNISIKPGV